MLEDPADGRASGRGRAVDDIGGLLDQGAAGQAQEDVLERRSADQDGLGLEPTRVDRDRGGLAVVGVEEDAIGQESARWAIASDWQWSVSATSGSEARNGDFAASSTGSISARGLPSATILALSMTTSRSHSCSASSM